MTRQAIALLLVAACVAGCGNPAADVSAVESPALLVQGALDAIRAQDGERLLACVSAPPGKPHDWRAFSGVEETLSKLGEVEFTAVAPESEPTTDQRVVVVPVVLEDPGREGSRVVGGLTLSRRDGAWEITARSLRALLLQALGVATGVSERERRTRLILGILAGLLERYTQDHDGTPPRTLDDLQTANPPNDPEGDPYISAVPSDGWGRPFVYEVHPDGTFELRSRGPDGIVGTHDDVRIP